MINEIDCRKKKNEKIIYFSAGTILTNTNETKILIEKIVEAINDLTDVFLITSHSLSSGIANPGLKYFQYSGFLPQVDLLNHVDLVISHGGTNTIAECLRAGIPVLCCPLSKSYDHWGNAARVIYHKIGERIDINYASKSKLKKKISLLLSKHEFKDRIRKLVDNNISDGNQFKNLVQFLDI